MTAAELLAQYGVTVEEAREWIMAHIDSPETIYSTAQSFGVTSEHLAELVDPYFPGVTAGEVEAWFSSQGFDGSALESYVAELQSLVSEDMADLVGAIIHLNDETGDLSTASLRADVVALTGQSDYDTFFDVTIYDGYEDGWFSASEIGILGLESFEATDENLESLYYGTLIHAFKAIDQQEIIELTAALENLDEDFVSDPQELAEYFDLLVGMFEDEAETPIMPDDVIRETIVSATAVAVGVVNTDDTFGLFDGLVDAF